MTPSAPTLRYSYCVEGGKQLDVDDVLFRLALDRIAQRPGAALPPAVMVEPGEVEPVAVAPGRGANPPACIAHRRGDPVLLGIGDGVERQARRPFAKPREQVFQRRGATLFADIERPDREAVPVGQPRQLARLLDSKRQPRGRIARDRKSTRLNS